MSKKDKEIERLNSQLEKLKKEKFEKEELKFQDDLETVMDILGRYSNVDINIDYIRFGGCLDIVTGRQYTLTFKK